MTIKTAIRSFLVSNWKKIFSQLEKNIFPTGKMIFPNWKNLFLPYRSGGSSCSGVFAIRLLLIMAMLTGGVGGMWGQTDYSGTYYIASRDYVEANTTTNYYLCPTEEWAYYQSSSPYYYVYSPGCNTDTPFMTTYQCRNGVYDSRNAVWIIEKAPAPNDAYYYIKHAIDGKYLTYNRAMEDNSNAGRMRLHLEEEADGDNALFQINYYSGSGSSSIYEIITKNFDSGTTRKYLNVTGPSGGTGNINSLQGTNARTDGPKNCKNVGGIIGLYTVGATDNNGKWYLEKATIDPPTITDNHDGTYTISAETDATIYYTIDGTTPTTSTTTYGTTSVTIASSSFTESTEVIKAIAKGASDYFPSIVTTYNLPKCDSPTIHFDEATSTITISSTTGGATIYYTTAVDDPIDPTFSTSTSGTSPITLSNVNSKTTVKAFAAKQGYAPSSIITQTVDKVATPVIDTSSGNSIVITCATEGATIYYTNDNSEPSTSWSIYSRPLTDGISGKSFRAFAAKANNITSDVAGPSDPITLRCATPVIKRGSGNTFTLSCSFPSEGVTIYYTIGSDDLEANPTSGIAYTVNTEIPFTGTSVTVKAIAIANDYNNSALAERTITEALSGAGTVLDPYLIESSGDFAQFIIKANDTGSGDYFKVTSDFTVGTTDAITQAFTGTFDGGYFTISGLQKPLFNTVNGGTVKNVVLNPDGIVSGNGAICNEADGNAKIYNCGVLSGTISGSGNVGGLVGHINSGSSVRVVNCYNFATVSGGSTMAGIVGNNEGTVGNVRIAMCMMYGEMAGTSPVYAGNHVSNVSNFTEYNYWRYQSGLTYSVYNDQLAIDKDEYLTRFPFYRHIQNTHRELAAYFLFAGNTTAGSVADISQDDINEIGHWIVDKDIAPYPIIEKWKTNTTKTLDAAANTESLLTEMGNSGYLTVTVKIGNNTYSASLPITDMDEDNYDYTWGKVVLPYANEFEVNSDYTKICTGWKITNVPGGNGGTFENYNVSDRDCTTKDLYSTTGFIFAQGGYYVVPYNVTEIEITANFATAYYLRDESYEICYSGNASESSYKDRSGLGGSTLTTYHGQTVYNKLATVLSAMSASGSTHEQAVVLIGNYHQDSEDLSSYTSKGYTIMSIDADNNQEPDYAIYSNFTIDRPAIPPTRFDFVAMIPLGMAAHIKGSTFYPNIPIFKPRGWFELTETSILRADQFELESNNFNTSDSDTRNYRCIINGGYFTQMVRSNAKACTKLSYYQIGGKAYVKEFYPGNHSKKNHTNRFVPINVTGGEIEQCFMTGYGQGTIYGTDIYFWCAGGKIGKFLGAYMEKPKQTSDTDGNVNLTAKIDHAIIGRFFGGGTSPKARITGNINITINNSRVDFYCGGPEFGDMANGKTVRTEANNTYFKEYYGAGFGGTAITYTNDKDDSNDINVGINNFPSGYFNQCYNTASGSDKGRLIYKTNYGIGSCYKFEFVMHSRGHKSVSRFFTGYSMFSLATTGNVTNILNDCEIETDFYGAGCQGKVDGTVTSTLTDCTVHGSAFGGGFKAESNQVDVYPTTQPALSKYNSETCIFTNFGTIAPETYEWVQGTPAKKNTVDETNKILYTGTDVTMSDLGNVKGAISITINGGTVAENVFGGGNESKSLNNTTVILKGDATIEGNVFGGGNEAEVGGTATVNIQE